MSETATAPQGGPGPGEPAASEPTEAPAPGTEGAASETTEPTEAKPSRVDRRIAALSARLNAGEQERARLAAENEQYRSRINPQPERPPTAEDIPRIVEERVKVELQQRQTQERVERFHEAGKAAYPDWQDRCESLMQMGADPAFAELLVETPDGARIAAALSDDPDEMERIAGLKTERARAIALGKFAAAMEAKPEAPKRQVSRAPAPIKPIGQSQRVEFNEATATTAQLVAYYSKQAAERQKNG